ncbi:ATPase [Methanospirillum hungatei JF-1]|jgi:AAA+ ATPase superfamily predicted ATPase|uniref:ATPase n=1 Tax=Methanospirillum hungatei JF-1 (strain ATCC 27890 / DSM 864 / NBRC 100397 / JF-1) TaxID=323259 RepID=Q2FLG9_METHJ|nr:ATP-binding protein [Methanospirillum hungatei]ABD39950.1 ATPase [Methanospirillum hungatei JF-1]MBP9007878.1 ATP-binding protein [Methanospirillum sp.]OQA59444.1 MAG: Archaeal ATPase [Euryarchaeota archaeon ADurb.Bin294]HOW05828.1 ATP-binding protein [Methanospirillum hungatei]
MSHINFINRTHELAFLEDRYRSHKSELIILYGRRRVGKTELLIRFLKDKQGIYILATTESEKTNIGIFAQEISDFLNDPNFARVSYPSFEALWTSFLSHHQVQKIVRIQQKIPIVIDEFPYLIERDRSVPSQFQRIWDLHMRDNPVMLVLSGSSISIMEQEVLGYKSPLYGRRTGQWQVEPLSFLHMKEFLPWSCVDLAQVWFTTGGIPAYLELFDPTTDFWSNITRLFLTKGAYLTMEAELLLQYEFREPANYLTILKAIAERNTSLGEIIQQTGLDRSMVSKYLSVLMKLHIVHEELPVTASPGSRKRRYRISDPYLSFWFRFIYPEMTAIEARQTPEVLTRVQKNFSLYSGALFELLTEHLIRERVLFPHIHINQLGRWWHNEMEIDLVSICEDEDLMICVECKWTDLSKNEAMSILKKLEEKSRNIWWRNENRKTICALVGKKISGKDEIRKAGYEVHDLSDIPY